MRPLPFRTAALQQLEPWAPALFAIGLCNLLIGVGIIFQTNDPFDFRVFYASACGWWHGTDPYALPNLNPPHASVLMAPLCALTPYMAWSVWQIVSLVAWLVALATAWRERPAPLTLPAVAVLVAHGSTAAQVHMGQVAWVLELPMTLSWRAFRRGEHARAGIWLGVVLAVKPFVALAALPALLDRRWRVMWLTATFTACGIGILGYVLLGGEVYRAWVGWSGPAVDSVVQPLNVGLTSLAWLMGVSPFAGVALGVLIAVAVLPRWLGLPVDRQWVVMLTLLVLSAPLGWLHYAAWTLPVLWSAWPTMAPRLKMWAVGLLCMPTVFLVLGVSALRLVYPCGLLLLAWAALAPGAKGGAHETGASSSSSPIINS
jgi:hypothetical protein